MKTTHRLYTSLLLAGLLAAPAARADLRHRYSFNEAPSATTVSDSVGNANGIIKGNGAGFDGQGQLVLPGGGASADAADIIAGYVDLPNGLISKFTNLTVEAWVTWQGAGQWQRIFDFGTSAGGEDIVNGDGNYMFLTPMGPNYIRFAIRDPAAQAENVLATAGAMQEAFVEVLYTVSYDYDANVTRLYSNGVQIATSVASTQLSTINDVNNWLGRSQWNDGMFAGTYNEFRIYDTAMTPVQVAASWAAGPTTPSTDPAALGAIQAVHLNAPRTALFEGDSQNTAATADFPLMSGIPLAGVPGVTYSSDNSSVVSIDAKGHIEAVSAGVARVGVSYLGKTDTVTMTVSRRQTGVAVAGNLYVDLRASGLTQDLYMWTNRVSSGDADFYSEATPAYVANVEGTGMPGIYFSGTNAFIGPISNEDLNGASDRSIEVWVFNPSLSAEETLVAWSHRGGNPPQSNMSFNHGNNATWGAVGHWDADVGWNGAPIPGVWHYLVYTYGGTNDSVVRVYADGVLKNTRVYTTPLQTFSGFPIRIGAQANNDGSATDLGQTLTGYIGLVRVHGGALSANDVKNNFLYGMELTEPGELQSITLSLNTNTIIGIPSVGQASVLANYAGRSYYSVINQSTLTSSDANVATVDTNGVITAKAAGTVQITATYLGKQAAQTLQLLAAPPAKLIHRYSFNEAVGSTTVKDLVGTADGIVKGEGAAFDGGQLALPGGVTSAVEPPAGYVDLPNGIISVLNNASFEAWVTWTDPAGGWQRIFDFGTSAGGEDVVDGNGGYLFLSPAGNTNLRFAVRDPATGTEPVQITASRPLATGVEVYVAVSYNYSANQSRLYTNAVLAVSGPASVRLSTINDVNNWLGRSQWNDTMFAGKFNEFRIWDGALTAEEIAASMAAGPNALPSVKPTLSAAVQGSNLVLTWPGDATGYTPEGSSSLGAGATWSAIPGTPTLVGGQYQLTVPVGTGNQFIRLKK